jgi:hypothetical protein
VFNNVGFGESNVLPLRYHSESSFSWNV